MQVKKVFQLPRWDDSIKQKIISFWTERGVVFNETSGDTLKGSRGSLWWNLIAFNMSKLCTNVTISVTDDGECSCMLDINTAFQHITEWNREHWPLELDTFESFIVRDDKRLDEWAAFSKKSHRADIKLILIILLSVFVVILAKDIIELIIRKIHP